MSDSGHFVEDNRRLRRMVSLMREEADRNDALLQSFFNSELQLLSRTTLSDLLDYILKDFRDGFHLDTVTLMLLDPEEAARALLDGPEPSARFPNLRLLNSQAPLREIHPGGELFCGEPDDVFRHMCFPQHPEVASCAILPLVRENCLIGSLGLGSADPGRFNHRLSYDYVSHLASVVSVCIENCISRETLQHLSSIDALTRVLNRRALQHQLVCEIKRCNRTGESLAYVLLDIDHFKPVNDQHGHVAGDRILRAVGQILSEKVRDTDSVARYGGEEFAILLPGCDLREAVRLAEMLRHALAELRVPGRDGRPVRITASLGVTICERQHTEAMDLATLVEDLVHAADQALYRSKNQGRNQTSSQVCPVRQARAAQQ